MKVVIVGAGGMGRVHARQYAKMPDVELGFVEIDDERAALFATDHPHARRVDADRWRDEAELVDVCLPSDLHAETALAALEADLPVFLEKPVARTWSDAVRIVETAERRGVPLMPGHVVRFFADFEVGHHLVAQGHVGEPAAARTRRGGAAPGGARGWFMDHARSGGVILDLAVHDFDWLRWTLGEVERVTALSVAAAQGRTEGPDYALITLKFASGAVGHVEATWMDPGGFRTSYEVAGPEGLIEYDSRRAAPLRRVSAAGVAVENGLPPTADPYYRELRGFLNAVRTAAPPPVTGRDGLAALAIALAAEESARRGGVPVRPESI